MSTTENMNPNQPAPSAHIEIMERVQRVLNAFLASYDFWNLFLLIREQNVHADISFLVEPSHVCMGQVHNRYFCAPHTLDVYSTLCVKIVDGYFYGLSYLPDMAAALKGTAEVQAIAKALRNPPTDVHVQDLWSTEKVIHVDFKSPNPCSALPLGMSHVPVARLTLAGSHTCNH